MWTAEYSGMFGTCIVNELVPVHLEQHDVTSTIKGKWQSPLADLLKCAEVVKQYVYQKYS
jgi:hypothetical protein